MGKNLWIGVGDTARKAKNIYIGVDGVARKVKAAWIGVNGVAQQFYPSIQTVVATEFKTVRQYYDGTYYDVAERNETNGVRIGASKVTVTSGTESYQYTGVAKLPALGTDWTKATLYIKRADYGYTAEASIDIGLWNPSQKWPDRFSYGPKIYSVGTTLGSDYYTYGIQDKTLTKYNGEWCAFDITNLYKSAGASYESNGEVWFIFQHESLYIYLDKTAMPYVVLE